MDGDRKFLRALCQQPQHGFEILPVHKDRLAVVAALDDVVRIIGKREAGQTGHGGLQDKELSSF